MARATRYRIGECRGRCSSKMKCGRGMKAGAYERVANVMLAMKVWCNVEHENEVAHHESTPRAGYRNAQSCRVVPMQDAVADRRNAEMACTEYVPERNLGTLYTCSRSRTNVLKTSKRFKTLCCSCAYPPAQTHLQALSSTCSSARRTRSATAGVPRFCSADNLRTNHDSHRSVTSPC